MKEKRLTGFVLVLYVLGAVLLHAGGLPRSWRETGFCRAGEGNLEFETVWDGGTPVRIGFRLAAPVREYMLVLKAEDIEFHTVPPVGLETTPWTALRKTGFLPGRQINVRMPVLIKFREHHWLFYLQNRLAAYIPAPGPGPVRILMPEKQARNLRSGLRFCSVPRLSYDTDFMIEEGAGSELYPWRPVRGKWGLHTALAEALKRPETNQGMTKRKPLTADKSPNFYSLKGTGRQAVIVTGYDFYDGFRYDAALQAAKGEGGILFYVRGGEKDLSCYGWTLVSTGDDARPGRLHLWSSSSGRRTNLRSFSLPVYQHQWYCLSVRLVNEHIFCFLDGVEIARFRGAVPPGGRIGLYADTDQEYRFDDIHLKSTDQQLLDSPELLEFETLARSRGFRIAGQDGENWCLRGNGKNGEQAWHIGSARQKLGGFAVQIRPEGSRWAAGVSYGYQGRKLPFFRLEAEHGPLKDELRLVRIAGSKRTVLESVDLDLSVGGGLSLRIDGSEPGRLRLICNGRLVFLIADQAETAGAFGVWLGAGSRADFSGFELRREFPCFTEQRQKNPIFQKDSYMRHWASPEGQWIGDAGKRMWHKGDFFGDFSLRMPWVEGSRLHLGIGEGQTDGKVQVGIRGRSLELKVQEPEDVLPATLSAKVPDSLDLRRLDYRICHEGYLLWVEAGDKILLLHRLRRPLKRLGTRVRVEKMTVPQLARSQARRKNVIDEFFYESPHAWLQNGGEWLIINRFQCTPSWSHMIGENSRGLASLWRKQIFKGDLTLEFYAGTRHQHYSQAGNLNCTIFADQPGPSRGYTATVTEWDQNLSQNWSRFYRNGRMLKQSDAYMVPRNRSGHHRRITNPLIASGRPIHGAWFYIKVRKIGDKIEYYFDDELIYTIRDKEKVLQEGMLGIWTFAHSMTLAQIKISFEEVRPAPVHAKALGTEPEEENSGKTAVPEVFQGTVGGEAISPLSVGQWKLSDSRVGSCRILPVENGIRLENQLGGGDMRLMPAKAVQFPLQQVAGWEFTLRLEKQAKINFLYEIRDSRAWQYFQQLNGGDFTRGNVLWTGRTEITPAARTPEGQKIRIWIPHHIRKRFVADRCRVSFLGFGCEQMDFQESGISGNLPGAAYEIRDFRTVFYEIPELKIPAGYRLYERRPGEAVFKPASLKPDNLTANWRKRERTGLNTEEFLIRRDSLEGGVITGTDLLLRKISWIHLPDNISCRLTPHPVYPGTLLLEGGDYPDPRLAQVQVWQKDRQISFDWERGRTPPDFRMAQHQALVPAFPRSADDAIQVRYQKKVIAEYQFGKNSSLLPAIPVLTEIRGFTPFYFRGVMDKDYPVRTSSASRYYYTDADSGLPALMISQKDASGRLRTGFRKKFRIAAYPVMQFFYRADDMANVSLAFGDRKIRLTEADAAGCAAVRRGTDWLLDGKWHSWMGIYADGMTGRYENAGYFDVRSVNFRPQTGRYSWMCLADMVFGPAVKENAQLYCTPVYGSEKNMQTVHWLLAELPLQSDPLALTGWQKTGSGTEIRPDAGKLKDGLNCLCLYGTDAAGRKSRVSVFPFLLDRKALTVSAAFPAVKDEKYNGTLLRFSLNNHGGSPWDYFRSKVLFQNRSLALPVPDNIYIHRRGSDSLDLNYPRLLRKELNQSRDGDVLKIILAEIYDGAGNHTPDHVVSYKVNYGKDKTPPRWFSLQGGPQCLTAWNWIGIQPKVNFAAEHNSTVGVKHLENGNYCMVSYAYYGRNNCRVNIDWDPKKYDRLAFRARFPVFRDKIRIALILNTDKNRRLTVSLQKPGRGPKQLNRSETYLWKQGEWQNFSLPVKQWLEDRKLPENEWKTLRIKSLSFHIQGTKHREEFQLDDFYIFDSDSGEKTFTWEAFDASGIRGAECIAEKKDGRPEIRKMIPPDQIIRPAELTSQAPDAKWLRLEAVDKAGNRAAPVWIPCR